MGIWAAVSAKCIGKGLDFRRFALASFGFIISIVLKFQSTNLYFRGCLVSVIHLVVSVHDGDQSCMNRCHC